MDITPITTADLLQANATLITGIFVLLTISILSHRTGRGVVILVIATAVPFIVSAGLLLHATSTQIAVVAEVLFTAGLFYLVVTLLLIGLVVMKIQPTQSSS